VTGDEAPDDGRKRGPTPADDDIKLLRLVRLREEPFATATDLVDEMNVGRKQTRNRLNDLVDQGLLNVETVGTTKVYWLSDAGKRRLSEALDESS
jgi:predicted ArsR family transcriptional regulator